MLNWNIPEGLSREANAEEIKACSLNFSLRKFANTLSTV
jgi:hypothetical protein